MKTKETLNLKNYPYLGIFKMKSLKTGEIVEHEAKEGHKYNSELWVIISKPNQKQFKQFDESLFKAYISKFSNEDKLKILKILNIETGATALGVGDGTGNLFVYGDYDSIKACQKLILNK